MKVYVLVISILFFSLNAFATELTPAEKMLYATGVDKMVEQAKEKQAIAAKEQVAIIMRQLSETLSTLPPETIKEIESLLDTMMADIIDSWTPEEAIRVYSQTWSENYTDAEILRVIEELKTPEAKKELQVALEASSKLSDYIQGSFNSASEKAFPEALQKMQTIMQNASQKKQGS